MEQEFRNKNDRSEDHISGRSDDENVQSRNPDNCHDHLQIGPGQLEENQHIPVP